MYVRVNTQQWPPRSMRRIAEEVEKKTTGWRPVPVDMRVTVDPKTQADQDSLQREIDKLNQLLREINAHR